jgi:putative iron-regulated protein
VERRTRIWIGLGTALLVGGTGVERLALARENSADPATRPIGIAPLAAAPRTYIAQVDASGEGGPGEGGGAVLGTITEFRLSSSDPGAFAYDASPQVAGYTDLVSKTYAAARDAATALLETVSALNAAPSTEALQAARDAWRTARAAYLATEAYLFFAGPVDGPGGPFPRLNAWPIAPAAIDALIADTAQSLNFRALAQLNRIEPPIRITTGLPVLEYLLWGSDGLLAADAFGETSRRGDYAEALARLLANDLTVVAAAWAPGSNNYRASVEAMDQRNALGRAFNGMTVLVGYEIPLRRIGAGLFPANENFQPSPFSDTSADANPASFEGARKVYFETGIDELVVATDPDLAAKIAAGFDRAGAALGAMNAPYQRFLAPPAGSPERVAAEAAARALTDLARDLRQAANRLGILVVVPGM